MTHKEFRTLWLRSFAAGISRDKMQKYVVSTGNYIWHIFSWRLLPEESFLEGNSAREAFDRVEKQDALFVEPFGEKRCKKLPQDLTSAADIEQFTEAYIAAPDFSWTYIKTHEGDFCGPYFCRKSDILNNP